MKKTDAWMPLYIADYTADTMHLTTLEHGAYLLLLMHHWRTGPLPDDDGSLAAIAKMDAKSWQKSTGKKIRNFFTIEGGFLVQRRLMAEREKAAGISEKRSIAGAKGGRIGWGCGESTHAKSRSERLANARKLARHSSEEWNALKEFCGGRCVRCGSECDPTKDHIKPIYQGGSDGIENLQPMCKECNSAKGPEVHDYRPDGWQDHIERLANAKQSAEHNAILTPTPSPSPVPSKEDPPSLREVPPRKVGCRLPVDWRPNEIEIAFATEMGLNADHVADRFRDFWHAKPGQGGVKLDWTATWRNWCREDAKRKPSAPEDPMAKLARVMGLDRPELKTIHTEQGALGYDP